MRNVQNINKMHYFFLWYYIRLQLSTHRPLQLTSLAEQKKRKMIEQAKKNSTLGLVSSPLSTLYISFSFLLFSLSNSSKRSQRRAHCFNDDFCLFLWNTLGNTLHKVGNGENRDPCHSHSQKFKFFYTGTHTLTRSSAFCFSLILYIYIYTYAKKSSFWRNIHTDSAYRGVDVFVTLKL